MDPCSSVGSYHVGVRNEPQHGNRRLDEPYRWMEGYGEREVLGFLRHPNLLFVRRVFVSLET